MTDICRTEIWFLPKTEKLFSLRTILTKSSALASSGLKENVFSNNIVVRTVVLNNIIVTP